MMNKPILPLILLSLVISSCTTGTGSVQLGKFDPVDEAFWEVVPGGTVVDRMGIDFKFTEGPAWHPDGYLILSDIPANTIYRWNGRKYWVFRKPSNNANGLLVEPDGSVLACEHGSRSLTRMPREGELVTLADRYRGMRLNSPNDLCRTSDGTIYFTDPPYGLTERNSDPGKEIPFNGVYRFSKGEVTLVDSTLSWPNGIALSPDERYLYVANFENRVLDGQPQREVFWMRYALDQEGGVTERSLFFSAPDPSLPGGPDGMKVDRKGNLFLTGPGGILVVDSSGRHLGTIGLPLTPANLAFGPKEKNIYVTARSTVYRIRLQR